MKLKFEIIKRYSTTLKKIMFYVYINESLSDSFYKEEDARKHIDEFDLSLFKTEKIYTKEVNI